MKALSIRQPWAWLIIHGGKDIENRKWNTRFRGRFLVHAAAGMTCDEYNFASNYAKGIGVDIPPANDLKRGGIIGSVELIDCQNFHSSPWYMGEKAFILKDPDPLPFIPIKGKLSFFEVDDSILVK